MVKNRKVIDRGSLMITSEIGKHPPRTGCRSFGLASRNSTTSSTCAERSRCGKVRRFSDLFWPLSRTFYY